MNEWDYVVVGAGAAGCIVAARLAESGDARVLLLESGMKRRSPLLSVPAGETWLVGDPSYDWRYQTEPDPTLAGRRLSIPRGRLLGGSNAINGLVFVRGQRADFEDWRRAGAEGWGWDDVLPYFRRLEDWQEGANPARGSGGPIRIELPRQREPLCDVFLQAATERGYPLNADYNSGNLEGFGYYQSTQRRGRRVSVVDGYLNGHRPKNLEVQTNCHVTGVILEGRKCTGVKFERGSVPQEVRARRAVVLCAGAIASPQLLELSGIGDPEVLRSAGISIKHALPGVGENFQDHFAARLRWRVRQRVTFNERLRGLAFVREVARYLVRRDGVLSLPIANGFGFVRSKPDEPVVDLQFHFAPASYGKSSARRLEELPGMTLGVYPLRPNSRGSIHVSAPDPNRAPAIRPRFLSDDEDLRRLVAGIRIAREIVSAPAFAAFRGEETSPGGDLVSDDDLREYARQHGDTSFHPMGTCKMGTDEKAVVDARLKVHGLQGLHVIDASVMPTMVSGNTQAATMMIAEKGAALLRDGLN